MGYYIRVMGSEDPDIHVEELIGALNEIGVTAKFELDSNEEPGKWTVVNILNQGDKAIAQLERNPVVDGELGQEELDEFREIIQDYKPTSAVKWLTNYFDKVKVIYAFQMLNEAFDDSNFEIISCIKEKIWNRTNGILQADNEGFSNNEGYHILWQFADDAKGEWSCAVMNELGNWNRFVMDLGDITQRQEFQNGKIPQKARLV